MKKILITCDNCGKTSIYESLEEVKVLIDKPCIICKEPTFTEEQYKHLYYNRKFYEIIKDFDRSGIEKLIDQILRMRK